MTKDQAIEALQRGEKITHKLFTPREYMKRSRDGGVEFEDGVWTTLWEFFRIRKDTEWLLGWSIFRDDAQ